ncbi:hypothetical protein [Actinophytocola glycyrrhizae]|uniref:OmpR/PhoB-type domain-containing protein n=1 Tax=Actinophytocola glycyrrhizae TaxID=2044873 RepID=A0ABV9SB16_9PSEU
MLAVADEPALAELLAKPVSLAEVVLRLRTLLRHAGMDVASPGPSLVIGALILDEGNHEVTRGGRRIDLTTVEFDLLRFPMRTPARC